MKQTLFYIAANFLISMVRRSDIDFVELCRHCPKGVDSMLVIKIINVVRDHLNESAEKPKASSIAYFSDLQKPYNPPNIVNDE